jgi:hypothetical protein
LDLFHETRNNSKQGACKQEVRRIGDYSSSLPCKKMNAKILKNSNSLAKGRILPCPH